MVGASSPRETRGHVMDDFESQVVVAKVHTEGSSALVPDFFDTLHNPYRKYKESPKLFATPQDGANWVFKVVGNMKRWTSVEAEILTDWEITDPMGITRKGIR